MIIIIEVISTAAIDSGRACIYVAPDDKTIQSLYQELNHYENEE